MATIPTEYRDLLDRPILVSLATIQPDGQPQVHPVWADLDGTHVRVNTAQGRRKHLNMQERPKVTVLVTDPDDAFRWMEIRGTVRKVATDGADAHIDKLARDYMGVEVYPNHRPDESRIICYVEPTRVIASG
ncbi:MAG TPA: PPOX class F420-dependent oxidoreductase [Thermomicrobiales bacterium]|nr:PPOX class F420-dependent oxidoreductase [Thermomicrobiales bacterium]